MSTETLLTMRGVTKRFGGVVALDGVDLEVARGEVHALVGENGAGKSTLMKMLSGAERPDSGSMTLGGEPYAPRGPQDALRRGVAMVYQELNLAPDLTVLQNLVLGRELHRVGVLRVDDDRARAAPVLELLDHPDLDPDRAVGTLGPGAKQLVEIGRALIGDARVVVLDEPTSSLSAAERDKLDEVIRRLRERGVSIVYISHFLEEVERICDRYTVLRDGRTVASGTVAQTSITTLVEQMVGRSVDDVYPRIAHERGECVLSLDALAGSVLPKDASVALHRGEILGIAGLVGAGRTELLRAIYGLDPIRNGELRVARAETTRLEEARNSSVRARIAQGFGFASEDRKEEGLALDRTLEENVTLSRAAPFSRFGWIDRRKRSSMASAWLDRLGVKRRGSDQSARELSGGNQQKVALARLLHQDADVWLLDEPTRGIDVGSKIEIYKLIGELAARGKAILIVSSYLPELLGVCDRIAVMHRGVLSPARATSEWTEVELLDVAVRGVHTQ